MSIPDIKRLPPSDDGHPRYLVEGNSEPTIFQFIPGQTTEANLPFENEIWNLIGQNGLFVDMGCGDVKVSPHMVGVDAYVDTDVKAFIWETPFNDNSVDGLTCLSALEHVSKFQVLPVLSEFARILKHGGLAIILVPDLEYVCQRFLDNPNLDWEMDLLFGQQTGPGQEHKTGFTLSIMKTYLEEVPRLKLLRAHQVNAYNQMNLAFVLCKEG